MRFFFVLALLLVFPFASIAKEPIGTNIQLSDNTLDNGVRVVVIPDRRAPVVTHMIWYKVGSADDPVGKSGAAHFLEHLLFKGTRNVPAGEFSEAVAAIGGQENAFTSHDYTAYYQKVSPGALRQMMEYEADRMRNVVVSDEFVLPERKVILEERSSRVDNNPSSILSEFTQRALYVHHPYGIPVIGWEHEIAKLERTDVLEFYEKWYQPWNAIVVVAGDIEPDMVLKNAEETYGKIKATSPKIERERLADPKPVAAKRLEYSDQRVTNPVFRRLYSAPSYNQAAELEGEALDLLATILGDSVSSRIYKNVVLEQELATSAGAFYQGSSRDTGYFGIYATPRGENSLETVVAAIQREIYAILENGVTQEELDRARDSYLQSLIFSQDSQVTLARIFGSILAGGGTIEDFTGWPERLNRVSIDDVKKAAQSYLNNQTAVTSYLLPLEDNQ
ncbi:MAG: pitrilysin family protein [Pseudomonadota bacterium]